MLAQSHVVRTVHSLTYKAKPRGSANITSGIVGPVLQLPRGLDHWPDINDRCQQGSIRQVVSLHNQWHRLIVGSPWRKKRRRWQEPFVRIYCSASNRVSQHNRSPSSSGSLLHIFPGCCNLTLLVWCDFFEPPCSLFSSRRSQKSKIRIKTIPLQQSVSHLCNHLPRANLIRDGF